MFVSRNGVKNMLALVLAAPLFVVGCSPQSPQVVENSPGVSHPNRNPTMDDVRGGDACLNSVTTTFHWTTDADSGFDRSDNGHCIAPK